MGNLAFCLPYLFAIINKISEMIYEQWQQLSGLGVGALGNLKPFSIRLNFPRGATFSFVYRQIGGEWASKDKRKYHSSRKIPPSGKRPSSNTMRS